MLDLGIDIDLDVKKAKLPFHFVRKNECVHCGGINTLIFVDKFGRESKTEINAFDHIKCGKCGRVYSIEWTREDDSSKMYPSAVDPSIKRDFMNMINADVKFNGRKIL